MTDVQNINLKRLTAPINTFVPTAVDKSDLYTIGISDHICSGYARGLYKVLTGLTIPVEIQTPAGKSGASPRSVKTVATEYKVYPNPASDILSIGNLDLTVTYSLKIYDSLGSYQKEQNTSDNRSVAISINDLTRGLYFLKVVGSNQANSIIKFVVE